MIVYPARSYRLYITIENLYNRHLKIIYEILKEVKAIDLKLNKKFLSFVAKGTIISLMY